MTRAPLAVVCGLLLLAGAACSSHAAMSRADARTFTEKALRHIGLTDVRVSPGVTARRYRNTDAWQTTSDVRGGSVVLFVPRKGDNAVFVRDTAATGGLLLTPAQVHSLDRFRFDPVADRRRRTHLPWAVAALVVLLAAAAALALTVGRRAPRSSEIAHGVS